MEVVDLALLDPPLSSPPSEQPGSSPNEEPSLQGIDYYDGFLGYGSLCVTVVC